MQARKVVAVMARQVWLVNGLSRAFTEKEGRALIGQWEGLVLFVHQLPH